jgi:transposase
MGRARVAIEVGTHSRWVAQLLETLGHEVIVANPRQMKLITQSRRKTDRVDPETLGRLARIDPELLRPIRHRGEKAQADLMKMQVRVVEARTSLINAARGFAKSVGERLPACDANQMGEANGESLPSELQQTLRPLLEEVKSLTKKIQASDRELERIARKQYLETELLEQVGESEF